MIPFINSSICSIYVLWTSAICKAHRSFILLLHSRKRDKPHLIIVCKIFIQISCGNVGTLGALCGRWYWDRSWSVKYAFTGRDSKDSGQGNYSHGEEERMLFLKSNWPPSPALPIVISLTLEKSIYLFQASVFFSWAKWYKNTHLHTVVRIMCNNIC